MFDEVRVDASPEDRRFAWHFSLVHLGLLHYLDPGQPALPERYISCDPQQVESMRQLLQSQAPGGAARPLRVGLRWSGEPSPYNAKRSIPLAKLGPLFRLPGIRWFALLEGGNPELARLRASDTPVIDMSAALGDLTDTAALMHNLDLVISVDTSVVHLGGALGVPTWLMERPDPNWRWGRAGAGTPWYSSVRVFRHPGRFDWDHMVGEVAAALAQYTERLKAAPAR